MTPRCFRRQRTPRPGGREDGRRPAVAGREVGQDPAHDRRELESVPGEAGADDNRPDPVQDKVLIHGGRVGAADVGEGVGVDPGQPVPGVALQGRPLFGLRREAPPVRVHHRAHPVPSGLDPLARCLHAVDRRTPVRVRRPRGRACG